MSDKRSQLVKQLTEALPYLTDAELTDIAATAQRKANWNNAMRRGLELAKRLREARTAKDTHATYADLLNFAQDIGVKDKSTGALVAAELWFTLAWAIAGIPRVQTRLARDTPLEIKQICHYADVTQNDLNLRPAVRQLLSVWAASFRPC